MNIEEIMRELPQEVQDVMTNSFGTITEDTFTDLTNPTPSPRVGLTPFTESDLMDLGETLNVISEPEVVEAEIMEFEESNTEIVEWIPADTLAIVETPVPIVEDVNDSGVVTKGFEELMTTFEQKLEQNLETESTTHLTRFTGAEWFEKVGELNITLIGAGGISSWCAVMLAKLNLRNLIIYDRDSYDTSNVAGQLFLATEHIGKNKAVALASLCRRINPNVSIYSNNYNCSDGHFIYPITILGVDSMASRKDLYHSWQRQFRGRSDALFIDGRLAAESYQLYVIRGDDTVGMERYEREWFTDEQGDNLACSYKQTAFMAASLASRMVTYLVNSFISEDSIPRVVPFYVEYTPYYEKIINYAYEESR